MIIQRGEQTVYLNHELIESVVRHENKLGKVSYVVTMASGAQTTEVDAQFERFVTNLGSIPREMLDEIRQEIQCQQDRMELHVEPQSVQSKPITDTIKEILADCTVHTAGEESVTKKRKK